MLESPVPEALEDVLEPGHELLQLLHGLRVLGCVLVPGARLQLLGEVQAGVPGDVELGPPQPPAQVAQLVLGQAGLSIIIVIVISFVLIR